MARSKEPLLWAPFSAGMMADALAVPALVVITGILAPLGLASEDTLGDLFAHPIMRAFVGILVALSLFHAAHRLRFALVDLGLKPFKLPLAVVLYGGAVVGSAIAFSAALGIGPACAQIVSLCACGAP